LDTGANISTIDEDLANTLGCDVLKEQRSRKVRVMDREIDFVSSLVLVEISNLQKDVVCSFEAWTVKNLTQNTGVVDWATKKSEFPHLRRVRFPRLPEESRITMIIGADNPGLIEALETLPGTKMTDPIAIRTPLGWGCVGISANQESGMNHFEEMTIDEINEVFSKIVLENAGEQ
jgi:hypothetical protein